MQAMNAKPVGERRYFPFLDGIRGLSALYVLIFHVIADGNETLTNHNFFFNFFRFGHEAVVVFIVLSGFVLTVPLAGSSQIRLKGGTKFFIARRARRILPGYYAALLLFPLYITFVEISKTFTREGTNWQRLKEMFLSGDFLSHLLLVQNVSRQWEGSINPVLWSMATEWWIYFVFALILIPLWRRFGPRYTLAGILFLGLLPIILLATGYPTLYGYPHLIMAFGLGMMSVAFLYSETYVKHTIACDIGLKIAMLLSFLAFILIAIFMPSVRVNLQSRFITDFLIAVSCAALIIKLSTVETTSSGSSRFTIGLRKFFELKPVRILGAFSYSLYLTHLVVLNIIGTTLNLAPIKAKINISIDPLSIRLFVIIPLLLIFAYGFYMIFEKPFLKSR